MRFFNRRFILAAFGIVAIAVLATIGGLIAYLKSPAFNARAQRYVIEEIERRTGAKVTLNSFAWSFWQRRIWLEGLTLRGLEPAHQNPLAYFSRIDIGLNFRSLLNRRLDLFELTFTKPLFHILVTPDGKTNFPTPPATPQQQPPSFEISVDNFNVIFGAALLNERRMNLDLSLQNLAAILKYHNAREVLEAHLSFDGVVDRAPDVKLAIPYTLSADLDYTRGTIIAHQIRLVSGQSEARLQGKISNVTSSEISGRLEYVGNMQIRFLNYFFEVERFAGAAVATGVLEFSRGKFFTQGHATSAAIDFESWRATSVTTEYMYRYPDRRLTLTNLKNGFMQGSVFGSATVENLPGPSRVLLDLNYTNIDTAGLHRAFPWDPKYRIFSTAAGSLHGWFEGKLARFDFSGHIDLASHTRPATEGGVAFPLDGSADFNLVPGAARVSNSNLRLNSTMLQADGLIDAKATDLKIDLSSSDLRDLAFLYPDANGKGTFKGSVSGAISKPQLDGEFTLENHTFRQWTIQRASGGARLDMTTENAILRNVRIQQGDSEVRIDGSAALSGSPVDLRVQSNRVTARDLQTFLNRNIEGVFAGDVRITGLSPAIRLEGDVRADNLSVDNHFIGNARGHVRLADPLIEIEQLTIRQAESNLTGNVSFNRSTEAVSFRALLDSVNLATFYPLGLPQAIQGVVRQAELRGDGTIRQPNVSGTATLQNLSAAGEVFPEARIDLVSTGPKIDVAMETGRNLNLKGQIDTATPGYPFTARASFAQYHLEGLTKFSRGSIIATGFADLSGSLTDRARLRGKGRIDSAEIRIQETVLRPAQPFTFAFDPDELTLSDVTVTGQSTLVTLAGTIGLRDPAPLNLKVNGQVDLNLIEAQFPQMVSSGVINMQVDVRGTVQSPDLRGSAKLENASLRQQGFFTSLTNVHGTLSFNQNQIMVNGIDGSAGGGTVHAEGTAMLQGSSVQSMNIQIVANDVRLRGYPEGLRTVIDANLNLRGSVASPLLEGNVQLENLDYRGSFEDFLALLREERLVKPSSPLGRLRLSLRVESGRSITIQNELGQVEARVNIDWKGTVDEPSITGHIEASGGSLLFQGNRYTITRGNIDFVDPLRIEPLIDIEAESQVRDYRVILSITGRGSNMKLAMRSDPPLSELEVVSLIAGGSTREEINRRRDELAAQGRAARTAAPTSEQLFQSGAASILFDLLQQRVGNRLGFLGQGRVRIDPFLVGTENNPGARITLSEQLTKDLTVTYSQDLASNRQQVVLLEYFFNRNTSIVASRDEFGVFGVDIRHRTRIK